MTGRHPLERSLGVTSKTLLDAISRSNRILVAVKGAIAQEQLRRKLGTLRTNGRIANFDSIDKDGQPDFKVRYRGRDYLIECKNVQKKLRLGEMTVDFMKTRYAKTKGPSTRFYAASEFDILAACLFNQTGKWEFLFIPTRMLGRHPKYSTRLDSKVSLGNSKRYFRFWRDSLIAALNLV